MERMRSKQRKVLIIRAQEKKFWGALERRCALGRKKSEWGCAHLRSTEKRTMSATLTGKMCLSASTNRKQAPLYAWLSVRLANLQLHHVLEAKSGVSSLFSTRQALGLVSMKNASRSSRQ
jgi:hypothetical protein